MKKDGTYTFSTWVYYEGLGDGFVSAIFQNSHGGDDRTGMDSFLYLGCSCSWLALLGLWWGQAEQGKGPFKYYISTLDGRGTDQK